MAKTYKEILDEMVGRDKAEVESWKQTFNPVIVTGNALKPTIEDHLRMAEIRRAIIAAGLSQLLIKLQEAEEETARKVMLS